MTCYEKYVTEYFLPIVGCPHHYNYMPKPADCLCISCFKDCWSREIPEIQNHEKGQAKV